MDKAVSNAGPAALVSIALTGVVMGGVLGALTNAINGALSPIYFLNVLRWQYVGNVWRAAVAQGIFEGLIYGAIFAVIFTLVVASVSAGQASLGFGIKYLARAGAIALACWCVGGVLAILLGLLSPEFYRSTFIGVPDPFAEILRYAWVGGSIWGVLFGAVLSVVIVPIQAAAQWRREERGVSLT